MGKVNFIIITLKGMSESKGVKFSILVHFESRGCNLVFYLVLIVFYVSAHPLPSKIVCLSLILTVTDNFHAKIV